MTNFPNHHRWRQTLVECALALVCAELVGLLTLVVLLLWRSW